MKIAVSGKGGVGKTTIIALLGEYLAQQGDKVWLLDADTSPSLAAACAAEDLPLALWEAKDIIDKYIGATLMCLNPDLTDLPDRLAVDLPSFGENSGQKKLLMLGSIKKAAEGCACSANNLVRAFISHLVLEEQGHLLIDMEAGLEHFGRSTISGVDALLIVTEPGLRSINTACTVRKLALDLGLAKQILIVNQCEENLDLSDFDLPKNVVYLPPLLSLQKAKLNDGKVLGIYTAEENRTIQSFCELLTSMLEKK